MKLSCFRAGFHEYEQRLDYYHGKDLVHRGCLLEIDPEASWGRISSKLRNKIRQAQKLDVDIQRVRGTAEEVAAFRDVWFDPDDPTVPDELDPDEVMYLARLDGELVGGLILTPAGTNLFMHNLGANEAGKRKNIPSLLLWHAVEDLVGSGYRYIDVGVSFRPTLYQFFKSWQTESYPIIFSPPFITPDLRLTPFAAPDLRGVGGSAAPGRDEIIAEHFGEAHTLLPRAISCLLAVLEHLGPASDQNVAIYKTFDNDYVSRCVTDPIEARCEVSRAIDDRTAAVLVIHEFGHPCRETSALKAECERRGIPLIEDCAWTYGTEIEPGVRVGSIGDFAIFSLPKVLPMQYGGVLTGLSIPDDENWSRYQLLDHFKREIVKDQLAELLPTLPEAAAQRRANWQHLAGLFGRDGFEPLCPLEDGVVPGAFLVRLPELGPAFERYEQFGVETGRYFQGESLFLPVHQRLDTAALDYIYAVFRGTLNLSSAYQRGNR